MKITFDASIHFGQFCTSSEEIRIACKNLQIAISAKPASETIGLVSFNENSWVDHIIWELGREQQDTFYPFMDVFHSVKNIERIPLDKTNMALAAELSEKLGLETSDALTCAIAIINKADAIHTYYPDLLKDSMKAHLQKEYGIAVTQPIAQSEEKYAEQGLEDSYQKTMEKFKQEDINLYDLLIKIKPKTF
jgi:hypothetical protein